MDSTDDTFIVIMLKDNGTGFLEKELGSYAVDDRYGLIYNTYAAEQNGQLYVYMKLSCGRDVEDWEYDAIFDYYDSQTVMSAAISVKEEDGEYNPMWVVKFAFEEDINKMEEHIEKLLALHKKELDSVYETIADKRDEYSED
ncbi:hypothetical protein SDC9_95493 [bioreactor metagenome]|uniref:Uncharacterized protein n=1 Tax=bioreactor metagenome TaxID=1076179 RepID=A0A645A768_9ZZZZ|nr:DUF6762 family protein [Candidatus Metalachnospira sp.]